MATIVVDELVTKLEYDANDAVLAQAEAAGKALEQQNKALAASADQLSIESNKLAAQTDSLTKAQIDLSAQITESSAKSDRLRAEQAALKEAIDQAGGATGKQLPSFDFKRPPFVVDALVLPICMGDHPQPRRTAVVWTNVQNLVIEHIDAGAYPSRALHGYALAR